MSDERPTLVLLHGLARTHRSLAGLRRRLERAGWPTWARTYPSRRQPIADLARDLADRITDEIRGPVAAVTHSLGGILVRHMAGRVPFRGVVMIAPPNGGSRVALAFRRYPLYRWFYGPAGQEVTDAARWPPPPDPFAVIAGTRASGGNPTALLSRLVLPRDCPSDGTVTVEETRLPGMADFATVEATHTWICDHPDVAPMVDRFLREGRLR